MAVSRRQLVILGCSLAAAQLAACTSAAPPGRADTYPLWRVQKGRSVVYLFGDGGSTGATWSSPRIEQALANSAVFWKETPNYTEADRAAYAARGVDPKRPLASWLTPTQREKVSTAAVDAGVPYARLAPLKPWLAAVVLAQAYGARAPATSSAADPLTILEANAVAASKPVRTEFADAEATLDWVDGMSREAACEYLMYTIDQQNVSTATWDRRKAAWARGDLRPMEAMVRQMKADYPILYPHLETNRNARWPARFRTMLSSDEATFVLVGAGHMIGPDSIPVQLAAAGMPAQRI